MKIIGILLVLITFFSCESSKQKEHVLPFLGNGDVTYQTINGKVVVDSVYPTIPYFYFRNQDSVIVRSTDLKGKIWVADFFFTSCSTNGPRMTSNMKKLNGALKDLSKQIQFISFSIDPETDKPSVMKQYIQRFGINASNWVFLTGNEAETHRLGIENFMIYTGQEEQAVDGFAHSEAFTLVDKEGYVRGVYNVSQADQLEKLEKDIRKLITYEYTNN
jgi:protein SCO1/2